MSADYGHALARIHDERFGGFAEQSAPELLNLFQRNGIRDGLVVDLGCGSGIWAAALCRAGYQVLGVDISPSMIALAKKRAPAAAFRLGSLLDAASPPCAAVTSLGECVCYLFDQRAGEKRLAKLFRLVHHALRRGGLFVFDVIEPEYARREHGRESHWEADGWAMQLRVEADLKRNLLTRRMTIFRKVGRHYRREVETHRLRMYESAKLAAVLRDIGFRVRTVRGYGKYRFRRGHAGLIARKR